MERLDQCAIGRCGRQHAARQKNDSLGGGLHVSHCSSPFRGGAIARTRYLPGQVPVKDLITRHIPLQDVMDAFSIVQNGEAIKVTVEP